MPAPRPERSSHAELRAIAELMRDFPAPWYVSGGWAIDTFLGRVTREHSDLKIGIARQDQAGIPVIAPEIELLYKAAHHRPRDEHDFHTALASLGPERRRWLQQTLQTYQPDDPWIAQLEE